MIEKHPTIIMASEPVPELTIEQATEMCDHIETEQELAHLYACISNKACWLSNEPDNFALDSAEYKELCDLVDPWFALSKKLMDRICGILIAEGVEIPETGKIVVLRPFMARNGFQDGNGWWIEEGSNHAV